MMAGFGVEDRQQELQAQKREGRRMRSSPEEVNRLKRGRIRLRRERETVRVA